MYLSSIRMKTSFQAEARLTLGLPYGWKKGLNLVQFKPWKMENN